MFILFCCLSSIFTIVHLWKEQVFEQKISILVTIALLLLTYIAVPAYWIYYFIKRFQAQPNAGDSNREAVENLAADAAKKMEIMLNTAESEKPEQSRNPNNKNLSNMEYKVVPFNANLTQNDSADVAARQLQNLIQTMQSQGYEYVSMEGIDTNVAGTNGCLGIGAKPGYSATVAVVVFRK